MEETNWGKVLILADAGVPGIVGSVWKHIEVGVLREGSEKFEQSERAGTEAHLGARAVPPVSKLAPAKFQRPFCQI